VLDFRDREKIICFVWDVAIPQHSLAPVALGERLLNLVNESPRPAPEWASLGIERANTAAYRFTNPASARRSDAALELVHPRNC
jgi:hypothetical protein